MGFVFELDEIAQMIEAEERLGRIMDMAAAHGTLKRHAHRAHTRDLQRQARGPAHRIRGDELTRRGGAAPAVDIASFGIDIVYVDAEGNETTAPPVSSDG